VVEHGACCKMLTAVYDLNYGTIAFDFVTWLVRAKLEQQRRGKKHLHVVIVPNSGGLGRRWGPHDDAATYWRLWHIVIGAIPLARASVTFAPTRDYVKTLSGEMWAPQGAVHFLGPLVDAARAGEKIPLLAPTDAARRWAKEWTLGGRIVTITLRNNNADDGRDSSQAWHPFADWLHAKGFVPLVLPDTADVLRSPTGVLAAVSIDLRAALYVTAAMNCFVNNGPMVLAWHTGAPFLAFNAALPDELWRKHWQDKLSLAHGDTPPWCSKNQRLIYRSDTLETLIEEFERVTASL
jgi:hypothetical protein